ncbi:hypothetical protein [Roseiconus lacunae]|uniref:Uncharacterized protein n=1 Tax=Roseiconus lacunae TaxID=2605694 RepID=A0ABT7PT24_9BACT|nr:hypothetical protein [Roseiconus lacunae]MDM4019508.1 hypothetical protein [Roseiconus lacunae]
MAQIQIIDGEHHSLKRSAWISIATSDSALVAPPPRMGRNPANGKPMQLRLPPDERAVEINGEIIGRFCWYSYTYPGPEWDDDLGVVCISFSPDHERSVFELAKKYASEMGADLVWD